MEDDSAKMEVRDRKVGIANLAMVMATPSSDADVPATPTKSASFQGFAHIGSDLKVPDMDLVKTRHSVPAQVIQKDVTRIKAVKQKLEGIMRKIPKDAEATTVLVGELAELKKPALCFVRLAEGTILHGLTEVPIPVRFLFILLGPGGESVDYHEIGRCFSTLMNNEVNISLSTSFKLATLIIS